MRQKKITASLSGKKIYQLVDEEKKIISRLARKKKLISQEKKKTIHEFSARGPLPDH